MADSVVFSLFNCLDRYSRLVLLSFYSVLATTSTFREIFPFFSSNDNKGANQVRGNKTASKSRLFTVSLSGTTDLIEEPLIDFIVMRNWTRLVLVHDNTMSNGFGSYYYKLR